MTKSSQMQVYVRRWRPSVYSVDRASEVILDFNSVEDLRLKLSQHSGIPLEDVQYAKVRRCCQCVCVCI